MKKIVLTVLCFFLLTCFAWADQYYRLSHGDVVVSSTAQGISFPSSGSVRKAYISIQGDNCRWKLGTPEANNGAVLNEGDLLILDSADELRYFQVILDSASSAATAYYITVGIP